MMRKDDWDKLCRNIYEGKCILLLGPEFPLLDTTTNTQTSFSKLLSNLLKSELGEFDRLPDSIAGHMDDRELSQLACDYINYKGIDKKINRDDLENLVADYLSEAEAKLSSEVYLKLAALPFTFVVNTSYTNFFATCLRKLDKVPETAYYNFRGKKIDLVESVNTDELGTKLTPFIYNLFGSVSDPSSLVLSENDLVQFVINIISRNPGLPANVKSELANQEKSFLFLGFGFLGRNWYFRILLQALESNNKGRMSYALECINNIQNDADPTVLFFRDELKLSLYHYDQKEFVDNLVNAWNAYLEKKKLSGADSAVAENAPRVFISYKSDDFAQVSAIAQRLKTQGVNVWIDRERLQGKWVQSIANEIMSCDAFVLMQSRQLKEMPMNYVNVEIKQALDKAGYFANEADFIFPCYIDDNGSLLTDYPLLQKINSYDLSDATKIDQLAKDIKRSYERNKRKRAA